jgi:hypothetical protein
MSDGFIEKVLAAAEATREIDDSELRQIEAKNRANSLIGKAEEKLKSSPNAKLNEAVAALGLALASGEVDSIREKSDLLESALSPAFDFDNIFSGYDLFSTQGRTKAKKETAQKKRPTPASEGITTTPPSQVLGKIFGGGVFTLDPQLCFVLMPFEESFQPIYDDHIKPAIEKAGLRCERADEIHGINLITWDIWERINRSRFLVAELTGRNSNVFYELGLAHALSKDVILLTQSMDFVPFDLKSMRCILYDFTPRGVQNLEKGLSATIQALMKIG